MSSQERIVVNYDMLEQSATSLSSIGKEFEHTRQTTDNLAGHLGSDNIADAMEEFSGNWNRKRGELTQKIKDTEGVIRSVMASFSEQDRQGAAKYKLTRKPG